MTKQLRYLCTLLLCMIASVGWAVDYQHVFTTKPSTGNSINLSGVTWNIQATNLGSYNSANYAGVQIGTSKANGSITLTSSAAWNYNNKTKITEVRLWLNLGGSSVTPTVTIGGKAATSDGTAVIKNSSAGSDWTKATKVTFTPAADGNTGVVIINVATVKAGYICAMEIDCVEEGAPEPCATPTFFPAAGTYTSAQDVEISTTTQDATIYYTLDGSTPTTSSSEYNGTIYVNEPMTIKAIAAKDGMNNSGVASAVYTIVNLDHAGTVTDPYTVADAYKAIKNGIGANGAYIKGIVSRLFRDDIMSDGTNYRYYISDDGNTNKELLVFKGKGLNNVAFSNANDLQAGDIVVIYGKLTLYNNTEEIDADNYIVSLARKEVPTLTFSEDQYSVVKNGNLTITATSNSSGTITYTSSNTDVAEVNATTGAITAKTAGTTNITATIAATDDYKSATATVELTVTAPKHTVTFYQNGTKLSEEEVVEDAAIEFPVPAAELYGKRFVGWKTTVITEPTNTKPTLVTSATMGTADVNYYAVYANQEGENTLSTATLTANDNWSGYSEKTIIDDKGNNWTGVIAGQKSNGVFHYGLTKPDNSKDPHLTSPIFDYDITDVKIVATNGSSKERSFLLKDGESEVGTITVNANTSDVELTASLNDIPFKQFTLTASDALQFKSISVTYGTPATYSDYCTTVKEQATIRLYLPNNPEGNLTEHQLSCGSAVNLNVDTNSPGAITIQDMTDGITVIPNTGNKTVTLLASTNNGKVFSQPGEYTFRVVVGETDSYTSASVDFKLKVVKFRAYFNNLTGFEETKDLANGTNGGQLKDQLFSNTQWGDASYKTWTSTNEDVATIDNDGNITLISTGQVRFTHSYTGNDYNEPCKISTGVMTVIDTTPTVLPTAPTIFHDSGEYEGELKVAIAGEGTIMYTLNDGEAQTYSAPFTITEDATIKAWAVKDGVASDVTEPKTFTIKEKAKGAVVEDGYYTIQNNDGKYVNVAGRKTVTLVSDTKSAGTVIRVKAEEDGVKVLRSQAVDLPRYAERAMSYVPELVKEVVKKLAANVDDPIIGEQGADLILDKFNKEFDYHLYLEGENNTYRIYGRTPSMKPVVDFYAENKELVDSRLPKLEGFVEEILLKVAERLHHPDSDWAKKFKVHNIWALIVNEENKLTEPVDEASTAKFFTEVLSSEANIWNFAHETAMIYWDKVKSYLNDNISELGDYGKYIEKIPQIRPNFKYYIVPSASGVDIISEGNSEIKNASTAWTLTKREGFDVTFDATLSKNNGKEMYKTLYVDFAYELPENVKALKVESVSDAGVAVTKEITGVVPAQTPVLLMSTDVENLTKTLALSTEVGTAVTDNQLVGADYLINKYEINTPQVESIFTLLANLSQSLANKYEYLKRKNAGTVNNKYFFGLTADDLNLCTYKNEKNEDDCVVRSLSMGDEKLGFYNNWTAKANEAFLVSETFNSILLTLKGDVYRDGVIDNKDLTALVEIVLGKVTLENKPENYDFDAAHVNEDEDINIADVTALVNILKSQPQD